MFAIERGERFSLMYRKVIQHIRRCSFGLICICDVVHPRWSRFVCSRSLASTRFDFTHTCKHK